VHRSILKKMPFVEFAGFHPTMLGQEFVADRNAGRPFLSATGMQIPAAMQGPQCIAFSNIAFSCPQ